MKLKTYGIILVGVMLMCMSILGGKPLLLEGLTREEAAVKIVETLGYEGIAKGYDLQENPFKDVVKGKGSIYLVDVFGIMNGVGHKQFNPNDVLTKQSSHVINGRIENALNKADLWRHGFYAISSSEQMDFIKDLDAVSFGWAEMSYDENKGFYINTQNTGTNDFKVPVGFQIPIDLAKEHQVETYLMIFFENHSGLGQKLFTDEQNKKALMNEIVSLSKGLSKEGVTREFDGITIDFENFREASLRQPFNQFLQELDVLLEAEGKKLNVAVQPETYFKGYDYRGIGEVADKVILMAHDYAPKKLTEYDKSIGNVYTPITPINQVYKDLMALTNAQTGIKDKSKVVLQISFGSVQWQTIDNKVIHDYPYTPSYDKIHTRLQTKGTQSFFDRNKGNAYAVYTENGITNTIWYEDKKSVQLKENLVQLLNLGGVSYWRLGTIPKDISIP